MRWTEVLAASLLIAAVLANEAACIAFERKLEHAQVRWSGFRRRMPFYLRDAYLSHCRKFDDWPERRLLRLHTATIAAMLIALAILLATARG